MYAFPQTRDAEARFWQGIREGLQASGLNAPDNLTRDPGDLLAHWTNPNLLFSQTCGRPYKDHLHGKVRLIGTPDYGVDGCPPGHYCSVVIARRDDARTTLNDFANASFALNGFGSQSGWAAFAVEAPNVLTGPKIETGSHHASIRAVLEDRADFAAIDAVTFRHLTHMHETDGIKIIHRTAPRPGLPFITNANQDPQPLFDAISDTIAALDHTDRAILGLRSLVRIPAEAYIALPDT